MHWIYIFISLGDEILKVRFVSSSQRRTPRDTVRFMWSPEKRQMIWIALEHAVLEHEAALVEPPTDGPFLRNVSKRCSPAKSFGFLCVVARTSAYKLTFAGTLFKSSRVVFAGAETEVGIDRGAGQTRAPAPGCDVWGVNIEISKTGHQARRKVGWENIFEWQRRSE